MRAKKISLITGSCFLTLSFNALAQKDSSGIYQTADDFINQRLTYAINYKTQKHKISDNLLFNETQVKVKHDSKTYTLEKSNTYGYKSTRGEVFRFVNNRAYRILNPGEEILIYNYTTSGHPKDIPKATTIEQHYFFSVGAVNGPVELTISNLEKAFPENHNFHVAITSYFKNDEELVRYDTFHKMYTVNWLLQMSRK